MAGSQASLSEQGSAEAKGAAAVYRIWPGAAPGSESWDWAERTAQIPWSAAERRYTRNVVTPTLTLFQPSPGMANGTAMIIAPGGAYHFLMMDHEGYDMARWLAARGVTAFVLKYRLGRSPDDDAAVLEFRNELQKRLGQVKAGDTAPPDRVGLTEIREMGEADGRQAIGFVRQHAADWGIDSQRIGIGGFSAGGGVAMGATFTYDAASRPDFTLSVYPAYRQGFKVPSDAPPLFLVIADNDMSVAPVSSARLYEAWHTAGKPAELHVFGNGAHGFGFGQNGLLSDPWVGLFDNWLSAMGLVPPAA